MRSMISSQHKIYQNQKQPSLWMLLGIAQCIVWFVYLPHFSKLYWERIFGSLSTEASEIILSMIGPLWFTMYTMIMIPIYYVEHPFFEQHKIQYDRVWPWKDPSKQVRIEFWKCCIRSISYTIVNFFILIPLLLILKVKINRWLDLPMTSFSLEDWPTYQDLLIENICMTVLHEFGFYMTHKWMHSNPFLYRYHKIHHEYKMNVCIAAQHNHPVDSLLSIVTPAILSTAIVKPHSFTTFQWGLWVLYANLDDHVGYAFPWSAVRWFPTAALTDEHEFHHSKNLGCYGSKLNIFNLLFGGYEHYKKTKQIKI